MHIDRVSQTLRHADYPWPMPRWVERTGSTNADLLHLVGAPEGTALIAGEQTAGRGRLGRTWTSAPGAGLWCSILVRPQGEIIPLVAGVAVARALSQWCTVQLKWPNDVVTDRGKIAGILAEVGDGVAVGIGINRTLAPVPGSVALSDMVAEPPDLETLCIAVLDAFARSVQVARRFPEHVYAEYRARSATLGSVVSVEMPGGEIVSGTAIDINEAGHLRVRTEAGERTISAGDVVHATLRP